MALLRSAEGSNRDTLLLLAAADVPTLNKENREKSNKRKGKDQGRKNPILLPHCLDNRLTDGSKVVSPTHPPHFTPQKHYYFIFLVFISVNPWA
jgi:hypothetical protein